MNINTRDMGFVNFNGEEMNWVKFNGEIAFELSKNLYDPNSPYLMNATCLQGAGAYFTFPGSTGGNRETYFFKCKPSTTYKFSCETVGDRFAVFGLDEEIVPTTNMEAISFDKTFKSNPTTGIATEYIWTTEDTTKMCAIYWSVSKKPTGIVIEEVK